MKMGYILIIVGIIFIGAGVTMCLRTNSPKEEQKPIVTHTRTSKPQQEKAFPKPTVKQEVVVTNTKELEEEVKAEKDKKPDKTPAPSQQMSAKEKGNEFESLFADIFKTNKIRIKEWNQGIVTKNGAIGENALSPDFFVIQKVGNTELEYWVECKWRQNLSATWQLPDYQYQRYRKTQRDSRRKIFVAIGIGGTPDNPKSIYVVPLDSLEEGRITEEVIRPFYYSDPKTQLYPRIKDYFFSKIFKK